MFKGEGAVDKDRKLQNFIRRAAVLVVALLFVLCCVGCDLHLNLPDFSGVGGTVTGVHLNAYSAKIRVGGQFKLSPAEPDSETFWNISDESVVSVENGVVTGLAEGKTVISTVLTTAEGREMVNCTVTVSAEVQGVKSSMTDATLTVGDEIVFYDGLPQGLNAEWSSSDEDVAAAESGIVTAISPGKAEITAVYGEYSASYTLTVVGEGELPDTPDPTERQLIWSDEFDGDTLDESKWSYQLGIRDVYVNDGRTIEGPWFWGNDELQYYTEDAVSLVEGVMSITAERKSGLPNERQFTSARIVTRDKGFWTYGYFEARMKLPAGTGMWPAFWLLPQPEKGMGTDNKYGGWPANGEIDIMEAKGRLLFESSGALHYGGGQDVFTSNTANHTAPITAWHTYALEWRSDHISWFVDDVEFLRVESSRWYTTSPLGNGNPSAPFDAPYYILINLAVGGKFDGGRAPDESFTSAAMQVDYVRVYA